MLSTETSIKAAVKYLIEKRKQSNLIFLDIPRYLLEEKQIRINKKLKSKFK